MCSKPDRAEPDHQRVTFDRVPASRARVRHSVTVRGLTRGDIPAAVVLHRHVLDTEFLASCGMPFLRRYYKAWIDSPHGVALCAIDGRRNVVGVLLGSVDPARHYRSMLRTGGVSIASRLVVHAFFHLRFARELVRTRGLRYTRALLRVTRTTLSARSRARARPATGPGSPVQRAAVPTGSDAAIGEITHLLVEPCAQGTGVGRRLVEAMVEIAQRTELAALVLVTPPDAPARRFYGHLGWEDKGEVTSGSGEVFVQYRLPLPRQARA